MFVPHRPLEAKLGGEFFHSAPRAPGVYTMLGTKDEILYIGQSRNLRHRLASYKNAQAGRVPRKVFRLVQLVERIMWTVCASAQAAQTLETQLIRRHRPRFNRQHTWPPTWFYLELATAPSAGVFRFHAAQPKLMTDTTYGPFKGITLGRRVFKSLVRLIWCLENNPTSPYFLPHAFNQKLENWDWHHHWALPRRPEWPYLIQFLEGRNLDLIEHSRSRWNLSATLEDTPSNLSVIQQILARDLDDLEDFFRQGPARLAGKSAEERTSFCPNGRGAAPLAIDDSKLSSGAQEALTPNRPTSQMLMGFAVER